MSDYLDHEYSGGCQCGAVRFHAARLQNNPHICYCRMCQKAAGNLFAALIGVRHEHLEWTRGSPSIFMSSEHVARGFCSACGTSLFYQNLEGEHVSLSIGAFDEPHRIPIAFQSGMEGKHPSLDNLDGIHAIGTTESEQPLRAAAVADTSNQHPDHDTAEWPLRKQVR